MKKKYLFILALITFIGAFVRLYKLSDYPVGFHIDEASLGYNAYSLLKTNRDENGNFLPLHIDMFGDFRPAGYQYLDILFIKWFGLTELATRLPSALFGVLTIGAIFLLAGTVFQSIPIALIAAGLLAVSPWHIVISRASAETIVALFFIVLFINYYLHLFNKRFKLLFFVTLLGLLSLFFYHTPRIFLPMLVVTILAIGDNIRVKVVVPLLVITVISLFLLFGNNQGLGRFKQVSIFHYPEIRLVLEEQIREDGVSRTSVLQTRLFHNKAVNYFRGYLEQYFSYFSLDYLFLSGGFPFWYKVPNMGLMYLFELPFVFLGVYFLLKESKKNKYYLIPVVWLILGPTIAALTRDDVPNVQRSLVMLPALVMITAYGFWIFIKWFRTKHIYGKRILMIVGIFLVIWNIGYFFHQYFVHAKIHRPWYRCVGFKEMVLTVDALLPEYDRVVVTKSQGGTYAHFLFFQKFDPKTYQLFGSPKDPDYGGWGKLIFVPQDCPTELPTTVSPKKDLRVIFVGAGTCTESPYVGPGVKLIKREDGTVVFRVATITKKNGNGKI